MKTTLSQLFSYRQYTGYPIAYCFDRKNYTICDSAMMNNNNDFPYLRYIPIFQITQDEIEYNYILQLNDSHLLKKYTECECCFEAFMQQHNLWWDDWWNYYTSTVYRIAEQWCKENTINYEAD